MPVWLALGSTLGLNVHRHLRGKSTLCSSARGRLPDVAFCAGWGALSGWLVPHYLRRR